MRGEQPDQTDGPALPEPPSPLASWHTKLVLLVGGAIVIVAAAVGTASYVLAQSSLRRQIDGRLEDLVSSRAALLRLHISHLRREVSKLSEDPELRRALTDYHRTGDQAALDRATAILERARAGIAVIRSLELLTPGGRVISGEDPRQVGQDRSSMPAFSSGRERSYLGPPRLGPGGESRAPLVTAVRAIDSGEVVAVLWAEVDMDPVKEAVSQVLRGWRTGEIVAARDTGGNGELLFRPPLEGREHTARVEQFPGLVRALRGESGLIQMVDYRGHKVLSAYSPVRLGGDGLTHGPWAITAKVDAAEAYAPVDRMRSVALAIAVFCGLPALALAYWFARRLTAPMTRLTDGALATAADPRAPIEVPYRRDEIGALARAFSHMREQLISQQVALESRVVARTAQLEAVNRRLTTEIQQREDLAAELRGAKEAAVASSNAKSAFLAAMSHEIRTPMNGIIGMAELLASTPLAPIQREYLGMVQESAESLLQVINDILDFSRIEAGRLTLEPAPFELRESVGNAVRAFADQAHRKGLELTARIDPEAPGVIVGDALRLRQILVNLIGNAIRFTERGEVAIEVAPARGDGGQLWVDFTVRDTGIGIPRERLAAVFEPFEQADASSSRSYGGTGLGLTIAQRIVEQMGGTIDVRSRLGKGSTFRVTVPFEVADEAKQPPPPAQALEGARVLVVDDSETSREILEEVLTQWMMEPTATGDAGAVEQLLLDARARGRPFHAVVLDANMPEVDGFALAERLVAHPQIDAAVILMLSSVDRPDDVRRCKEIGVDSYLLKPVKQSDLLEAIQRALGTPLVVGERQPHPQERAAEPLRILVAEDNPVSQRLAMDLLTSWGHTVVLAATGIEAVDAYRNQPEDEPFDVIIMDVQMPDMDGFEATGEIRAIEARTGEHVPIVAMTAHAMKGDRERCLAAGMDGYVSKPIRAEELRFTLQRHVGRDGAPVSGGDPGSGSAIDWEAATASVDGQEHILRSMAEAFLQDCPERLAAIRDAVGSGDRKALLSAAHSLKGAAQAMAANRVAELAKCLEDSARAGHLDDAAAWQRDLEPEAEKVLAALVEYLGKAGHDAS